MVKKKFVIGIIFLGLLVTLTEAKNVKTSKTRAKKEEKEMVLDSIGYKYSISNINRIVCPPDSKNVQAIFSTEKNLTAKIVDNNVFLKFTDKVKDREMVDLYVKCDDDVHELFGIAYNNLPPQVYYLERKTKIKNDNLQLNENEYEKLILEIVRLAYLNKLHDYEEVNKKIETDEADIILWRSSVYRGFIIDEYTIHVLEDVKISEKSVQRIDLGDNIVAISIENRDLKAGDVTRMIVVRRVK